MVIKPLLCARYCVSHFMFGTYFTNSVSVYYYASFTAKDIKSLKGYFTTASLLVTIRLYKTNSIWLQSSRPFYLNVFVPQQASDVLHTVNEPV